MNVIATASNSHKAIPSEQSRHSHQPSITIKKSVRYRYNCRLLLFRRMEWNKTSQHFQTIQSIPRRKMQAR